MASFDANWIDRSGLKMQQALVWVPHGSSYARVKKPRLVTSRAVGKPERTFSAAQPYAGVEEIEPKLFCDHLRKLHAAWQHGYR